MGRPPLTEPQTPDTERRPPHTQPRTPRTQPRTPDTEPRTPDTEPRTPDTEPRTPDMEPRMPHMEPRTPDMEPRMPGMGLSALEGERWLGAARTLVARLRADRFLSRAGERRASARMDRSARLTETACRYSTISMGAARLLRNITEREW